MARTSSPFSGRALLLILAVFPILCRSVDSVACSATRDDALTGLTPGSHLKRKTIKSRQNSIQVVDIMANRYEWTSWMDIGCCHCILAASRFFFRSPHQ